MLELSLAELAFIGLIALIFIGPKELPAAMRGVAKALRFAKDTSGEIRKSVHGMLEEVGMDDVKRELEEDVQYIQDLEGNYQRVYDVSEIEDSSRKKDEQA